MRKAYDTYSPIINLSFELKDISTYRSELMGWSILWIMMLHFTFIQVKPLGFIAQYGFAGVDIFMLVSGLGLFYSLENDSNILRFYKKRLLRIFPTYYCLGFIVNLIVTHNDFLTFLFSYSTIGFWTGGVYADWFIPSIIAFYLVAPYLKKLIDQKQWIIIWGLVGAVLVVSFYVVLKEIVEAKNSHFFMMYRFPAFIFGMICAYWIKNNKSIRRYYYCLIAGLPFFIYLYPYHHQIYNFKYFSLLFILPLFIIIFVLITKNMKYISKLIGIIGHASLEIYIIQGIFFSFVITGKTDNYPAWHDTMTIGMIIISTALGIMSHWLINKLLFQRFLR